MKLTIRYDCPPQVVSAPFHAVPVSPNKRMRKQVSPRKHPAGQLAAPVDGDPPSAAESLFDRLLQEDSSYQQVSATEPDNATGPGPAKMQASDGSDDEAVAVSASDGSDDDAVVESASDGSDNNAEGPHPYETGHSHESSSPANTTSDKTRSPGSTAETRKKMNKKRRSDRNQSAVHAPFHGVPVTPNKRRKRVSY